MHSDPHFIAGMRLARARFVALPPDARRGSQDRSVCCVPGEIPKEPMLEGEAVGSSRTGLRL